MQQITPLTIISLALGILTSSHSIGGTIILHEDGLPNHWQVDGCGGPGSIGTPSCPIVAMIDCTGTYCVPTDGIGLPKIGHATKVIDAALAVNTNAKFIGVHGATENLEKEIPWAIKSRDTFDIVAINSTRGAAPLGEQPFTCPNNFDQRYEDLWSNDMLLIISTGNNGYNSIDRDQFKAVPQTCFPHAIAVGASSTAETNDPFSTSSYVVSPQNQKNCQESSHGGPPAHFDCCYDPWDTDTPTDPDIVKQPIGTMCSGSLPPPDFDFLSAHTRTLAHPCIERDNSTASNCGTSFASPRVAAAFAQAFDYFFDGQRDFDMRALWWVSVGDQQFGEIDLETSQYLYKRMPDSWPWPNVE